MKEFAALPHSYKRAMEQLSDSEFGRLMRALIDYSADGTPIALTGNERFYAGLVMMTEDEAQTKLEALIEEEVQKALIERAQNAAKKRWEGTAMQASENVCKHMQAPAKRKEPKENTHNDSICINNNNNNNNINNNTITSQKIINHYRQYGEYGWIRLTDEQYAKLLNDLGESLLTDTITKLDEYCQQNGNKGKYKDFNLVIRKAVREHWFERTGSTKRPNSKEFDERDVHESEFASGFYADVMNRKRPGEGV